MMHTQNIDECIALINSSSFHHGVKHVPFAVKLIVVLYDCYTMLRILFERYQKLKDLLHKAPGWGISGL